MVWVEALARTGTSWAMASNNLTLSIIIIFYSNYLQACPPKRFLVILHVGWACSNSVQCSSRSIVWFNFAVIGHWPIILGQGAITHRAPTPHGWSEMQLEAQFVDIRLATFRPKLMLVRVPLELTSKWFDFLLTYTAAEPGYANVTTWTSFHVLLQATSMHHLLATRQSMHLSIFKPQLTNWAVSQSAFFPKVKCTQSIPDSITDVFWGMQTNWEIRLINLKCVGHQLLKTFLSHEIGQTEALKYEHAGNL